MALSRVAILVIVHMNIYLFIENLWFQGFVCTARPIESDVCEEPFIRILGLIVLIINNTHKYT